MASTSSTWGRHDPLRPSDLASFAGQPQLTKELDVVLGAAKKANVLPDHLLFAGPPGLGKTTLAHVVAHELGLPMVTSSGPALERGGDLAALVSGINEPSVLFLDEIHRLGRAVEEILYPVMEDAVLDLVVGEGPTARTLRLETAPLVVVGATTQLGLVSAPLRDRFGYAGRLSLYDDEALAHIVVRSAGLLGLAISGDAALALAKRGRGTPRLANAWLRRVRDLALHDNLDEEIDVAFVERALDLFGVDALGLDEFGRTLLGVLCAQFGGGPVGLSTLAAAVGEAPVTIEEVYEPYLLRQGLLGRTPRGRVATRATYEHLGLSVPAGLEWATRASEPEPDVSAA